MKYNEQIYQYIKAALDKGFSKEAITEKLINSGYEKDIIDIIIKDIEDRNNKGFFGLFNKKKYIVKETPQPEYQPNIIVPEKKGLSAKVDELNEKMDMMTKPILEKKNKHFNLPNKITRQLKKLAEKNKILVILLRTNKKIEPIVTDIRDGFICINGVPHNCSMDFIYLWKGKFPAIVLNEWDLNPIGTKDYYDAVANNRTAPPVAVVLRMLKSGEELMKNKMEFNKTWIFIGIAVIIILYLIFGKGA